MIKAYSIGKSVVDHNVDKKQTENLEIIIRRVLGQDELGRPGEVKLYKVDKNISNHKFSRYAEDFLHHELNEARASVFCDQLADNLLKAELTEDQSTRNKNILAGILIIKISSESLILIKLEDVEVIDPITFEIKSTIGLERAYLKAAIFTGDESSVRVIDRQRQVANFWSSKFLQLIPVRTDLDNTQIIADAINNHQVLNEETFSSEEIDTATSILAEYVTKGSHFDLKDATELLQEKFPDKKPEMSSLFQSDFLQSIDEQFEISSKAINIAFRKKIKVNEVTTIDISNFYHAKKGQFIEIEEIQKTRMLKIKVQDDYLDSVLRAFSQR